MTTQPTTPPSVKYVSYSGGFTQQTVDGLIAKMSDYHNDGFQEVYLMLSTTGGNIEAGLHLYTYLRGLPFKLTIHNIGYVYSVGITVFLAGDQRYASPPATFMFHGVAFTLPQEQRLDEPQLVARLESIRRDTERLGSIIQERTRLDEKAAATLFSKAETKDAAWAKEHGLIQEIKDLEIPRGSQVDALTPPRKAT